MAQAQNDPAGQVIQLVNELRISRGLPAYQVDSVLMQVAQAQATWSAANNHIGHDGPGGSSPNDRAQAADYGGGSRSFAIENAAHGTIGYNTPELVVTMWQSDWGHLNAMISADYEHIGVGYAEANGYSWYVMMVGWVADGSPPAASPTLLPATPVEVPPYSPFVLSAPAEDGAIYHTVQAGQTAWSIAAAYGIELANLLALNYLTEPSLLYPGDVLLIQQPDQPSSTPTAQLPTETPVPLPSSTPSSSPATSTALPSPTPTGPSPPLPPNPTPTTVTDTPSSARSPVWLLVGAGVLLVATVLLAGRRRRP